ncbi:MAG: helix-turn-helix domain-containing protein [Oscillospiraceae bacterium]
MYKTKSPDGQNNLCGRNIAQIRKNMKPRTSQRMLAEKLQVLGIDMDKNAVQRIECGKRFVTDIELKALSQILKVPYEKLLQHNEIDQ